MADALSRAHHLGIIHRDIKPTNVLLAEDGTPRLTDFGVAHFENSNITQAGSIVGTLAYLSPEAFTGEELDVRSDIWSFGILLFKMLTGQMPFEGNSPSSLIHNILTKALPQSEDIRSDIPVALADLMYRMLEKNRDMRIPRMRMVGAELELIYDHLDISDNVSIQIKNLQQTLFFDTLSINNTLTITPARPLRHNNLPIFATQFIGRNEDLFVIQDLLNDPNQRLITIVGLGGVGKTRLAVASASENLQSFPNGVFFVPLDAVNAGTNIVRVIAENIGFNFTDSGDFRQDLLNYLKEKQMLLILDNFEHLIYEAGLISDILQHALLVTFLVTSRERLRVQDEYVYELDVMAVPDPDSTMETIMEFSVVQLFIENARRVAGDFEINEENAAHIAKITNLVLGIPLGIQLATGWLELLHLDEIIYEIERSLDFLETNLRDVPERHRSLRAVFEYSWKLLNYEEQDIFKKLSVFRGGFERDAVLEISGASLHDLMNLVNKSLLRRKPDGRYIEQKVLREYAEELFSHNPQDQEETRHAHARYYTQFIKKQGENFDTKYGLKAIETVANELDNILATWEWSIDNEAWPYLNKIIKPLSYFFGSKSMLQKGVSRFSHLANLLDSKGLPHESLYWTARSREAIFRQRLGDYGQSYELAAASLDYFQENPDVFESAFALNIMSYTCIVQGRYEEAINFAQDAVQYAYALENTGLIFRSMGNLGYAKFVSGDLEEAKNIYEEINDLADRLEYSPIGRAVGLNHLGEIMYRLGEINKAKSLYEQAHDIFKSYGNRRGMATTLNNLAGIYDLENNHTQAVKMYNQAYQFSNEIGDLDGIAHTISALGHQALRTGDWTRAEKLYNEALVARRSLGNKSRVADSLADLSHIMLLDEQYDVARQHNSEAFNLCDQIGDLEGVVICLLNLALCDSGLDDLANASAKIEEAMRMIKQNNLYQSEAYALYTQSNLAMRNQNYVEAEHYLKNMLRIAHNYRLYALENTAIGTIAELYFRRDKSEKAIAYAAYVIQQNLWTSDLGQRHAQWVLEQAKHEVSTTVIKNAQSLISNLTLQHIMTDIFREA